ncbi:lysine--tRNA ligase [Dehalococcoidia bacterium]|nr:lysine--tRNA ligase [Dehalococcoidia bacterium]
MPERGKELTDSRLDKLQRLRNQGINPYPQTYRRTHTNEMAVALFLEMESQHGVTARSNDVAVAGRITALRSMGKASFIDLRDSSGRLQVYLRPDKLKQGYNFIDALDLGDFLGAKGVLFKTRTGEITVEANEITILSKAIRPPPEKWHGLRDVETRYRQRYLDLMANPQIPDIFQLRSKIISAIRSFLDYRKFTEVETPVMVPVAAGAMARPFVTTHFALDRTLYLRIATELYLKRLIVGGMDRVYEIGRVFRNEGIDIDHNPEFTMLESYEAYANYTDVMDMLEDMVASVAKDVIGSTSVTFHGHEINLNPPWPRMFLKEELQRFSGINIEEHQGDTLAAVAREHGVDVHQGDSRGKIIDKLLNVFVEPNLIQPTFLVDYPVEMSPLAKSKPEDPRYVERFEVFIGGIEVANAFTELNDPQVQRDRFEAQESLRKQYGDEDFDRMDEEFLVALEYGMPPTGGLGVGIDRLVMILTGQRTIRDVVLFPQLRGK